jgi:hypothetical protein
MSPIFDLPGFFGAFQVAGIPLLFLVVALVEMIKDLPWNPLATRWLSVLVGVLLGFGFWLSSNPFPSTFASWFTVIIFGIALGVLASRIYDASVSIIAKAQVKAIKTLDAQAKG